jgi:hypothetical protein
MNVSQQIRCIEAIFRKLKEMVDLNFPAYGSLYFAETPYLPTSKLSLNREFCIGPHASAIYWNCNAAHPKYYHNVKPNQGPCTSPDVSWDWEGAELILQGPILPNTVTVSLISESPKSHQPE